MAQRASPVPIIPDAHAAPLAYALATDAPRAEIARLVASGARLFDDRATRAAIRHRLFNGDYSLWYLFVNDPIVTRMLQQTRYDHTPANINYLTRLGFSPYVHYGQADANLPERPRMPQGRYRSRSPIHRPPRAFVDMNDGLMETETFDGPLAPVDQPIQWPVNDHAADQDDGWNLQRPTRTHPIDWEREDHATPTPVRERTVAFDPHRWAQQHMIDADDGWVHLMGRGIPAAMRRRTPTPTGAVSPTDLRQALERALTGPRP